jgi:hypothetical protein
MQHFIKPLIEKEKEEQKPIQLELPLLIPENMPYIIPVIKDNEELEDYEIYGC